MKQAKHNTQFICPICHYLEVSKRAKEFNFCPRCGADIFYFNTSIKCYGDLIGGKE